MSRVIFFLFLYFFITTFFKYSFCFHKANITFLDAKKLHCKTLFRCRVSELESQVIETSKVFNFRSKQATNTKLGTQSYYLVVNFYAKNHVTRCQSNEIIAPYHHGSLFFLPFHK